MWVAADLGYGRGLEGEGEGWGFDGVLNLEGLEV